MFKNDSSFARALRAVSLVLQRQFDRMNRTVVLPVRNAGQASDIVMDLKALGLIADRDFAWRYQPSTITNYPALNAEEEIGDEVVVAPTVTFTFVEESMASFIRLKYN